MSDVAARLGANLKRLRRQADLSQEALSLRASLHRTEVSLIERGLRIPKADTIVKLAGSLEIGPGVLFDGIAWQPGDVQPGRFKPERRVPCGHA